MTHRELDTVVLTQDLPEHRLQAGDVGAVVHVYEGDGLEVEFVSANGGTRAVLTLRDADVRSARPDEMLAVRSGDRSG